MSNLKILIIDGNDKDKTLIERALSNKGHSVFTSSSCSDGMDSLENNNIDLVIVDPQNLVDDSTGILNGIRSLSPETQIIVTTSSMSYSLALDSLGIQATDYIPKPVDPDELIARNLSLFGAIGYPDEDISPWDIMERIRGKYPESFDRSAGSPKQEPIPYSKLIPNFKHLPKRPRSHILETESGHFIRGILPYAWLMHEHKPEYGKDILVEVFYGDKATGLEFVIQAKGTDHLKKREHYVYINIDVKNLVYLSNLKNPSMILLYDAQNQKGYYIWVQDYISKILDRGNPTWADAKTVRIKIPLGNEFNYKAVDDIFRYLLTDRYSGDEEHEKLISTLIGSYYGYVSTDKEGAETENTSDALSRMMNYFETAEIDPDAPYDGVSPHDLDILIGQFDRLKPCILGYAERASLACIDNYEYEYATYLINSICKLDASLCRELSKAIWEKWLTDPNDNVLESATYWLVDLLPINLASAKYIRALRAELRERFGNDIDEENLRAAVTHSPTGIRMVSIDFVRNNFLSWLEEIGGRYCHQGKIIVDWLDYRESLKKDLFDLLDDAETDEWGRYADESW